MLRADVKQQWVSALRSDRFVQVYDTLFGPQRGDGKINACLLGVLQTVAKESNAIEVKTNSLDEEEYLLNEVIDWAGLTPEEADMIALLNDNGVFTFEDFAEFLETFPEDGDFYKALYARYDPNLYDNDDYDFGFDDDDD